MKKKETKKQRNLKVYTKYTFGFNRKVQILPEIRLKGEWLREWGYECGDQVKIINIGNVIIINNSKEKIASIRL